MFLYRLLCMKRLRSLWFDPIFKKFIPLKRTFVRNHRRSFLIQMGGMNRLAEPKRTFFIWTRHSSLPYSQSPYRNALPHGL